MTEYLILLETQYYIGSQWRYKFESSTTHWCVTRREVVKGVSFYCHANIELASLETDYANLRFVEMSLNYSWDTKVCIYFRDKYLTFM